MINVLREIAEKLWMMQREPPEPEPSDAEAVEWYEEWERYEQKKDQIHGRS